MPTTGVGVPDQDADGANTAGGSPKKRWVRMASGIGPSSSRGDAPTDPTQFTAGPTSSQTTSPRQSTAVQPVPGAAPVPVTPGGALGFIPCNYTAALPSPGSVFFNLAQRLERALNGAGEPIDAARQANVVGVLLATEMYAETLGQSGMKKCLEAASWTDPAQLQTLAQHLTQLGSHLLFPLDEPAQAAQAPSLPILLKSHYERILEARTESQLQRHCHALTCFLQSAVPGEHVALNRACIDYLERRGTLQGVIDALVDVLKNDDHPDLLTPQFGAAPLTLIGRTDVRRGLETANSRQQQFNAREQWMQQAGELENWLRSMDRLECPLGTELLALVDACVACRMSNGNTQAINNMRDALGQCVDAASSAARDVQVKHYTDTIRTSPSQWGSHYSSERITTVVDYYLKHPTATAVEVVRALGLPYEAVDRLRAELRKYVASSVPAGKHADVLRAAVNGTNPRDYGKRVSQLVRKRLVNPETWELWNKMVEDYRKEFPQSGADIFSLVSRRDASLIHRIPDVRPLAGAVYMNLFGTDDNCCMPVEDAYDMFKDALAAAKEAGAVAAGAGPTQSPRPLAQSVQPKNQ